MEIIMSNFTEEITVIGRDLKRTVERLFADATVDRFKIVNRTTEKTVLDVPALVGLPTMFVFHIWSLIGATIMFAADYTIVVERTTVPTFEVVPTPPAELVASLDETIHVGETVDVVPEVEVEEFERCQGVTKLGEQCKRSPMEGLPFCYAHRPD